MNRKFKHFEYSALLDELARQTAVYTQLLNENGTSDKKDECRIIIQRLLAEINFRERERESESNDPANRIIR